MSRWQPIASFFDQEPDAPCVLLWAPYDALGECAVHVGYWNPTPGNGTEMATVPASKALRSSRRIG